MRSYFLKPNRRPPGAATDRSASPRVLAFPVQPVRPAADSGIQPAAEEGPPRNVLLAALPPADVAALRPHVERVRLELHQVVFEPGTPIRAVYFPETAVVSLVHTDRLDTEVEVGSVGCEGMVGLPFFLRDELSCVRAVAQIPGIATRMSVEAFDQLTGESGPFRRLLLRYTHAVLIQLSQTAVCNAAHVVQERCARWLLTTHDRVGSDDLQVTHDALARMLGVRRGGVTVAMRALQDTGAIFQARGSVEIVERARLEAASCECYQLLGDQFRRLLPPSA